MTGLNLVSLKMDKGKWYGTYVGSKSFILNNAMNTTGVVLGCASLRRLMGIDKANQIMSLGK